MQKIVTLTSKGVFTVKSFYNALKTWGGNFPYKFIWKVKLPLKIEVFVWLVLRNSILAKIQFVAWRVQKGQEMSILWIG